MSNFWKNEPKSKHTAFRKVNQRLPHRRFNAQSCLDGHSEINNSDFLFLSNVELMSSWRKENVFGNGLRTFYPIGLNQKEEYLY